MLVFYFMEWTKVLYNGLETNVEVTKCGKVRRVKVDWFGNHKNSKIGEVDLKKLKLHQKGYIVIGIQVKQYKSITILVQQLMASAFLGYKFGNFPNEVVMHLDDNPLNNNLSNLKIGSNRENLSQKQTIKSGLPVGVYFRKDTNKYQSQIYLNGKNTNLGLFNTIEEASYAYQQKLKTIYK